MSVIDGARMETLPGLTVHETIDGKTLYKIHHWGGRDSGVEIYAVNPDLGYEIRSAVDNKYIMAFSFRLRVPAAEPRATHPFFNY